MKIKDYDIYHEINDRHRRISKISCSLFWFFWIGYNWWLFFTLLLLPDLSMIGYLINTKVGAFTYNMAHHQAVAIISFIAGYLGGPDWLMLMGLVLFGHSAMDRVFGYGLKYPDAFEHTHLGWIGGSAEESYK